MRNEVNFCMKTSTSNLTASRKPQGAAAVPRPRLDESRVLGCAYGNYPWDEWERFALAQGLERELAALGRLTVREAYQHQWDDRLKSLCGWRDDGQRMLRFALRSPAKARDRWNRLLDTDGYRGEWKDGQWFSRL